MLIPSQKYVFLKVDQLSLDDLSQEYLRYCRDYNWSVVFYVAVFLMGTSMLLEFGEFTTLMDLLIIHVKQTK